ncbi:MAG: hypothetical protein JW904_06555 [Spirochaetales bacterium]|nr:hypothetical protein [Spirochaetales bacterium]
MLDIEGRPQVTINDHGYFAALWVEYNIFSPSMRRLVMQTFNPDGTTAGPLGAVSENPGIATIGIRSEPGFDISFKNTWELAVTWIKYTAQTSGLYTNTTQVVLQRYFIDGSALSAATGLSDEAGANTTTSERYTYMSAHISCARNYNHYIVGWANLMTGKIQYSLLLGDNY